MMNGIWTKVSQFLGNLNRENVNRESYVRTPEYDAAEKEKEWETFAESLSDEDRERVEDMKECLEIYASEQEQRSYMQGYVDCVQALWHMGILKENKGIPWTDIPHKV